MRLCLIDCGLDEEDYDEDLPIRLLYYQIEGFLLFRGVIRRSRG